MGIQEKIKEIEFEMSRTQKNKATEGVRRPTRIHEYSFSIRKSVLKI